MKDLQYIRSLFFKSTFSDNIGSNIFLHLLASGIETSNHVLGGRGLVDTNSVWGWGFIFRQGRKDGRLSKLGYPRTIPAGQPTYRVIFPRAGNPSTRLLSTIQIAQASFADIPLS